MPGKKRVADYAMLFRPAAGCDVLRGFVRFDLVADIVLEDIPGNVHQCVTKVHILAHAGKAGEVVMEQPAFSSASSAVSRLAVRRHSARNRTRHLAAPVPTQSACFLDLLKFQLGLPK